MKLGIGICLTAATFFLPNLVAADDSNIKIEELTCFEVLSLPQDDMLFFSGMLIGYGKAQAGDTDTSLEELIGAIEKLDAACGDNPDAVALETMKQAG